MTVGGVVGSGYSQLDRYGGGVTSHEELNHIYNSSVSATADDISALNPFALGRFPFKMFLSKHGEGPNTKIVEFKGTDILLFYYQKLVDDFAKLPHYKSEERVYDVLIAKLTISNWIWAGIRCDNYGELYVCTKPERDMLLALKHYREIAKFQHPNPNIDKELEFLRIVARTYCCILEKRLLARDIKSRPKEDFKLFGAIPISFIKVSREEKIIADDESVKAVNDFFNYVFYGNRQDISKYIERSCDPEYFWLRWEHEELTREGWEIANEKTKSEAKETLETKAWNLFSRFEAAREGEVFLGIIKKTDSNKLVDKRGIVLPQQHNQTTAITPAYENVNSETTSASTGSSNGNSNNIRNTAVFTPN